MGYSLRVETVSILSALSVFRKVFIEVSLDNGLSFINNDIAIISEECVSVGSGYSLTPGLCTSLTLEGETPCGGRKGNQRSQASPVGSWCDSHFHSISQPAHVLAFNEGAVSPIQVWKVPWECIY